MLENGRYYFKVSKTKLPSSNGPGDPQMIDKINIKKDTIKEIISHYDGIEIEKILYKETTDNIVKKVKYRIPNEVLKTLKLKRGKTKEHLRVILPEEYIVEEGK